jgi:hypothetical protein
MVTIGYMDGTDAVLLSKLAAADVETIPISNGWDSHGKYIGHLSASDGINAVVGYFHKFTTAKDSTMTPADLLEACKENGIKVFVIARKPDHAMVAKALGNAASDVTLVTPRDIEKALLGLP